MSSFGVLPTPRLRQEKDIKKNKRLEWHMIVESRASHIFVNKCLGLHGGFTYAVGATFEDTLAARAKSYADACKSLREEQTAKIKNACDDKTKVDFYAARSMSAGKKIILARTTAAQFEEGTNCALKALQEHLQTSRSRLRKAHKANSKLDSVEASVLRHVKSLPAIRINGNRYHNVEDFDNELYEDFDEEEVQEGDAEEGEESASDISVNSIVTPR